MNPLMDAEDAVRADIRKALKKIDAEIAQANEDRWVSQGDRERPLGGAHYGGKRTGLQVARAIVAQLVEGE